MNIEINTLTSLIKMNKIFRFNISKAILSWWLNNLQKQLFSLIFKVLQRRKNILRVYFNLNNLDFLDLYYLI